jgi:hypothetical protein
MSRGSWKLITIIAVGGLAFYSVFVMLLSSSDEQNVSGLRDQRQVFLMIWIALISGGLGYFLRGLHVASVRRWANNRIASLLSSRRSEFPQYLGTSTRYPREYCPYFQAGTCRFRAMTGRDTSGGPEQRSLRQGSYTECAVWAINPR